MSAFEGRRADARAFEIEVVAILVKIVRPAVWLVAPIAAAAAKLVRTAAHVVAGVAHDDPLNQEVVFDAVGALCGSGLFPRDGVLAFLTPDSAGILDGAVHHHIPSLALYCDEGLESGVSGVCGCGVHLRLSSFLLRTIIRISRMDAIANTQKK